MNIISAAPHEIYLENAGVCTWQRAKCILWSCREMDQLQSLQASSDRNWSKPRFQKGQSWRPSVSSVRLSFPSSFSPRRSSEPAHLHPGRCSGPSDHLAGTQLRNCASRQMPCRTVGDGGGGVTQSVSAVLLFLPPLFCLHLASPQPSPPGPPLPPCQPRLVHLSPGNSGEAVCVGSSQQLPSITAHCSVAYSERLSH